MPALVRAGIVAVVCASLTVACGYSSRTTGPSRSTFCAQAAALFNNTTFSDDGTGVVAALRGLDLKGLTAADRASISTGIDLVERNIAKYHTDQFSDGWSTRAVTELATQICGVEMKNIMVMP